jgi:hypothetical protein
MARQVERITVTPLTPDQRRQMHDTLERIVRLREALLADRGGRPFGSVSDDLAAIRDERERQLP